MDNIQSVRPGLSLLGTHSAHRTDVRAVLHDPGRAFTSVDDASISVWRHHAAGAAAASSSAACVRVKHHLSFPPKQKCFITAIAPHADHSLLFCACLDNSLKVYNSAELELRSSCAWPLRGVSALLYNARCHELLVLSASQGLQAWSCRLDSAAELQDRVSNAEVAKHLDTSVPWNHGKYLLIAPRASYQ
jgi:hypothetical protein